MSLGEVLLLFLVILNSLGLGGLVYWLRRAVQAQEYTIRAQTEAMKAQGEITKEFKSLLEAMKVVVESADEKKMLERLKAYKEFVDHEKDAAVRRASDEFEEEKRGMAGQQQEALRTTGTWLGQTAAEMIRIMSDLLPYVPTSRRMEFIQSLNLPEVLDESVKQGLRRIAEVAPDLSGPPSLATYAPMGLKFFRPPPLAAEEERREGGTLAP